MADEREQTYQQFREAVNMTGKQLQDFLSTEESLAVGQRKDGGGQMKRTVSYVHRHLAQGGPKEDAAHSRWRYSLMNWGHDPLKG